MAAQNFLGEIIGCKKREIAGKKRKTPFSRLCGECENGGSSLARAIRRDDGGISIIAEIKCASPSSGIIRKNADIPEIAGIYGRYAQAISVVTDEKFFGGSLKFLGLAKSAASKPVLGKDFILDEYQIYEMRKYGADAVLLIAAILNAEEIGNFIAAAGSLGMECVVEVRNEKELRDALRADAEIIGINNRDLRTFRVDRNVTSRLLGKVPGGKVIISESGISGRGEVEGLKGRVDAVLVGTALMKAENMETKIRELAGC